jgi:predicted transcriptional regulator
MSWSRKLFKVKGLDIKIHVKETLCDFEVRQAMALSPQVVRGNNPLSKAVALTLSTTQVVPVVDQENKMTGLLTGKDINQAYRLLAISPINASAQN